MNNEEQVEDFRRRLYVGYPRRPVPDDVEIEILRDEHPDGGYFKDHLRVGDRIGAYVNYVVEDDDDELHSRGLTDHYYQFVDYGPYLPVEDRPPYAKSHHDYCLYLEGLEDDRREEESRKRLRAAEEEFPILRRNRVHNWMVCQVFGGGMFSEYGDPIRKPDAPIHCSACGEKLGDLWRTDRGWLVRKQHIPMKEGIASRLLTAMEARDKGLEWVADYFIASADRIKERDTIEPYVVTEPLNDPPEGEPPFLLIGCRRHFNVGVTYPHLRRLAKAAAKSGRRVSIDCTYGKDVD